MAQKTQKKVQFGSRLGLIAATVGSAVGLGNIWRFPAEVHANGGGAFLLVYIICLCVLGIPVMIGDFTLGRGQRSDAVGVFQLLAPKSKWWLVGALSIVAAYLILSFYMVVAGWTADYLWESLTGALYNPIDSDIRASAGGLDCYFGDYMARILRSDLHSIVSTGIVLLINVGVLVFGVKKGIEKASMVMMPLLFVLLLVFAAVSLQLDGAMAGLVYFFKPDFSLITPQVVINALGQGFFSMSLGMGILITYASYYPKDEKLTQTAVTVSLLDLLVSVIMGVIICPVVMTFGFTAGDMSGASLVFVTLPEVFAQMPGTQLWSVLFFLLLFMAAVTSTISLAEVIVALFQSKFHMRRVTAVVAVILSLVPSSLLCALSGGSLSWLKVMGMNIFDLFDNISTNICLPLVALFTTIFIGWVLPRSYFINEITNQHRLRGAMASPIYLCIKYLCPLLILAIFVSCVM